MCVNAPEYLETFFAAQKLGCGPGERQLPLRRRRARVPARQLRLRRARVPRRLRGDGRRRARDAARRPPAAPAAPGRARRRRRAARRRASTTQPRSPARPHGRADRPRAVGRRPRLPLHRRHDRQPEGRDVAQRRPLRRRCGRWRGPGTEPPDVATAMRAGKQRRDLPARVPADARHRTVHRAVDARRAAAPSCCSTRPASTPTRCGTRSSASTCRCARSSATRSRARCSPRSTPRPTAGTSRRCARSRRRASRGARRPSAGCSRTCRTCTLIDSLGASEGIMTRTETRDGDDIAPARFKAERARRRRHRRRRRSCSPATRRIGMLGVGGPIPLGYYKDPEKTAATFRTVDGRRYSIPGDYATVDPDGTIRLLGRGSACINTGGEKVYPEEVELALRSHPDVFDCVVVGVPDDRWGEMVVALVQPRDGAHDRRRRARRALPRDARRRTRCRSSVVVVDSLSVRPRARPTTSTCARSRSPSRSEVHHVSMFHGNRIPEVDAVDAERGSDAARAARRARSRRVGGRPRARRAVGAARRARGRALPAPDEPPHRVRVPLGRPQRPRRPRRSLEWGFDAVEHGRRHEGVGRVRACPSSATTALPARSSDQPSPGRRPPVYRASNLPR